MALGALSTAASALFGGAGNAASSSSSTTDHAKSITKEIRIKSLYVHPIKSCRGCSVSQAEFDASGLRFDRTWLIVDASTLRFCTARELPRMVTISPRIDAARNELAVEVPLAATTARGAGGTVTVRTPLEPSAQQLAGFELVSGITIWNHKVDGYAVSREADQALSEFFGKPVRLVRKGPSPRPSGPDDPRGDASTVRYQDFYPLLLASDASLRDVQSTLLASVHPSGSAEERSYRVPDGVRRDYWTPEQLEHLEIERFRPNIVVTSAADADAEAGAGAGAGPLEAWEEDGWSHVEVFRPHDDAASRAYGAQLAGRGTGIDCVARCARCMVPNVDPGVGYRDPHLPYLVLQKFRQVQPEMKPTGKPCFGMLSVPSQEAGVLHVGDIVRVTATRDPAKRTITVMDKKRGGGSGGSGADAAAAGGSAAQPQPGSGGSGGGGSSSGGGGGAQLPPSSGSRPSPGPSERRQSSVGIGQTLSKSRSFRLLKRKSSNFTSPQLPTIPSSSPPPPLHSSPPRLTLAGLEDETPTPSAAADSMLSPPRPAFMATRSSSVGSSAYSSQNASSTSLSSSLTDDSSVPSGGGGGGGGLGRGSLSTGTHSTTERRFGGGDGPPATKRPVSPVIQPVKGSKLGSLGRRVLARASIVPSAAARSPSQTRSSSSSATAASSSPPATPTTPPRLPAFGQGLFGGVGGAEALPQLPPLPVLSTSAASTLPPLSSAVVSPSPTPTGTSERKRERERVLASPVETLRGATLPAVPAPSAPPAGRRNSDLERGVTRGGGGAAAQGVASQPNPLASTAASVLPEELGDSDMLRAVLNLSFEESDTVSALPGRGSSSARPTAASSSSTLRSPLLGGGGSFNGLSRSFGSMRLTEAEVRQLEERERRGVTTRYRYRRTARAGLFGSTSDSEEDDYGEDEEHMSTASGTTATTTASPKTPQVDSFPSTLRAAAANKRQSVSPVAARVASDHDAGGTVGLDTAPKRAVYACTLLRVHPQLAECFPASPGGSELVPGAQAALEASRDAEVQFPRSMNPASRLRGHASTYSTARSLRVALARTVVMRKLKWERLPLEQEVELAWFLRRYGSEVVSPEAVAARLAQRPSAKPEALAKPPVAAPSQETRPGRAASYTGMAAWARRASFDARCVEIDASEGYSLGDIVFSPHSQMPGPAGMPASLVISDPLEAMLNTAAAAGRTKKPAPIPDELHFSARVRSLAGLPEHDARAALLRRMRPAREGRGGTAPASMHDAASPVSPASPGGAAGRPAREPHAAARRASRAPPPWIAPRSSAKRASTMPPSVTNPGAGGNGASPPGTAIPTSQPSSSPGSPSMLDVAALGGAPSLHRARSHASLAPSTSPSLHSLAPPARLARRSATYNGTEAVIREDMEPAELYDDLGLAASSTAIAAASAAAVTAGLVDEDGDDEYDDEEEVPLAMLHNHRRDVERRQRAELEAERRRAAALQAEVQALRRRSEAELREVRRRAADEERRRREADALLKQAQKQQLREARERRRLTQHPSTLSSPTYGAGDPMLRSSPSKLSPSAASPTSPQLRTQSPPPTRRQSTLPRGASARASLAPPPPALSRSQSSNLHPSGVVSASPSSPAPGMRASPSVPAELTHADMAARAAQLHAASTAAAAIAPTSPRPTPTNGAAAAALPRVASMYGGPLAGDVNALKAWQQQQQQQVQLQRQQEHFLMLQQQQQQQLAHQQMQMQHHHHQQLLYAQQQQQLYAQQAHAMAMAKQPIPRAPPLVQISGEVPATALRRSQYYA